MRAPQIYNDVSRKLVIIVGGYSSGALLAPAFRGHGYYCLHIQPDEFITPLLVGSFHADDYLANLVWNGKNIDEIKAKLHELGVQAGDFKNLHVLAGSEVGVMAADAIAHALDTKTQNVFELSEARRHKQAMQAALKAAGVRSIAGFKAESFEAIPRWMAENQIGFPIVIKPDASAGTDHVAICQNLTEAKVAFDAVLSSKDVEGKQNFVASVQEFIRGVEYVVNTVSHDGQAYVTDILRVTKVARPGGSPAYDTAELLCPVADAGLYDSLGTYVKCVLPALGIRNGAGHSEIIIDTKGPVLVETAARTMGAGLDPAGYSQALGYNHPSATVDAYLRPHLLPRFLLPAIGSPLLKHQLCVFMLSPVAGRVEQAPELQLARIKEFFSAKIASLGCQLEITRSLNDCPGLINVVGTDPAILQGLYREIRAIEGDLFTQMLTLPTASADNPFRLTSPSSRRESTEALPFSVTAATSGDLRAAR